LCFKGQSHWRIKEGFILTTSRKTPNLELPPDPLISVLTDRRMVTETSPTPSSQQQQSYLRLATIDELEKIVDSGFRAFLHDPVLNYFGNVKKVRSRLDSL